MNLPVLLDSNGTIPFSLYPRLIQLCEGVMLDVKAWDAEVYHALTGARDNNNVRANIHYLVEQDKLTEIRIVCLPEGQTIKTDVENILHHLAQIQPLRDKQIPLRLNKFRPQGVVGAMAHYPQPDEATMQRYQRLAESLGLNGILQTI